jgi:hypothetical protein
MVNIWKLSTLGLAGALALVVSQGQVRETQACGIDEVEEAAAQQTQIRLSSALSLLDRAEQQLLAARNARPLPRAKALEGIALAKSQVLKGLDQQEPMRKRQVRQVGGTKAKEIADE